MVKRTAAVFLLLALLTALPNNSFAQFKRDTGNPNISGVLTAPGSDFLFGFLDPSKISMHHSMSMSYGMAGQNGMALSTYMNTIDFQLSENLFLQTNLGIMSSPYNTFGENFYLNKPKLFGGAKLHYKINDHSSLFLQVQTNPGGLYQPGLSDYYYHPFQ
jgi:hypothetical protein